MKQELTKAYLEKIKSSYKKANKLEKSEFLDHAQKVTDLSRKRIIKILNSKDKISIKPQGRPRLYTDDIAVHLVKLYPLMERICPKRMKFAIPLWLESYEAHFGALDDLTREKLLKVSPSTIRRILNENKAALKGKSSTRQNLKLKKMIPIKKLDENVTKPGTVQADTVAHCGTSLSGSFAYTLTVTDVFTGWTENRACWTKEAKKVKAQLERVEFNFPINFKYFDTDCGSEFLNHLVLNYFENNRKRKKKVKMRRGRPYKKNDQCYVEQKNYTHVRNLFQYDRIDDFYFIDLMNDIYSNYWNPLHNYFLPSVKLEKKVRIGSYIKKTYDDAKTPAQRMLSSIHVKGDVKRTIRSQLAKLDPIELKENLEEKLSHFFTTLKRYKLRQVA